jgi:hypothetical protein
MERMDALTVREKDGKSYFTKCGVAFPAKQGEGWNVYLDALPVNGQLILRPPKPRESKDDDPPFR